MCVLFFSTFAWNVSHSTKWDMIKNVYWSSCTVPIILVKVLMKPEFSQQIFEKYSKYQIPGKSVPWQPGCSTHRQTLQS